MFEFLIFVVVGTVFLIGSLILNYLVRRPSNASKLNYECGMEVEGTPLIGQNIRFYPVAMLFLLFDIEVVFLVPWAIIYKNDPSNMLLAGFVFMGILFIALLYIYNTKTLKWE
ncbi:MAG: NADH-quinone oxidoreductase subunit A [bacterium]|nr:NADH-quinone oxidoreductase subunit A [bacterium]